MVQPWYRHKFGEPTRVRAMVSTRFEFDIEDLPDGPVHLCVERPERWRIALNDIAIDPDPNGWWVDIAFKRIAIPADVLRRGKNTLTMSTPFTEETNLEAVYLIGDFGVRVNEPGNSRCTLIRRSEVLDIGDITTQGFPFYGGSVIYRLPSAIQVDGDGLTVEIPDFEGACVKVRVPGGTSAMIAFPPYHAVVPGWEPCANVDIEVVLTRRNTFGPLASDPPESVTPMDRTTSSQAAPPSARSTCSTRRACWQLHCSGSQSV